MGFYYGPSSPPPDDDDDDKFRLRDAIGLVLAMFKVMTVPFAILTGGMLAVLGLFVLFTINILLGYAAMGIGIGALVVHALWDSKRPKAKSE